MLKAVMKKEIMITNKEIAHFLFKDGGLFEDIDEILEDMLYEKYKMDCDSRHDAIKKLTTADYIQILAELANEMGKNMNG